MPRSDRTPDDHGAPAPDPTPAPAVGSLSRPTRTVADFRPYPNAPTRTRRSPANTAGGSGTRPRRSLTPPTVWFIPPTTTGDQPISATTGKSDRASCQEWSPGVLGRVVTSFSDPGAAVLLLPWPELDNGRPGTDPDGSDASETGLDAAMATALALDRFPIAIRVGTRPGSWEGAANQLLLGGNTPYGVTLLITVMPAHAADSAAAADEVARFAASALRIGGSLVVLTRCDWHEGELRDPTGPMVASAQSADLLYLQHIVAVEMSPRDPRFGEPPQTGGTGEPHLQVHSDVLVFVQPHSSRSSGELKGSHGEPEGRVGVPGDVGSGVPGDPGAAGSGGSESSSRAERA